MRRYGASIIDGFFMIFLMVLAAMALQAETRFSVETRIMAFLLILFAYEPVLTSREGSNSRSSAGRLVFIRLAISDC